MNNFSELTTDPIPVLIRRLAIPAGTGFFFNTMFNVVDIWYGGRLSTTALAAMSLSFPVFFILLSIGAGVSTGTTALIGHALGRNDHETARIYILQALSFALLNALFLTALGISFSPEIFMFMGAREEYLALALSYIDVVFAGAPFFMLNFVMSAILNAHGNTATYRNFLICGFLLNLLLDPWFMYGGFGLPALGLPGVALSTVAIQCLGNFYLFNRLSRTEAIPSFTLRELRPQWNYYRNLFGQGFPAAMNMMTVTLGIFIITWFVGRYGQEAVAAYGIGTRIEQIALLPVMGLNISTLALTAQNFGAGQIGRVRQVLVLSLRYGFVLALSGTAAALIFTGELMRLFSSDEKVVAIGIRFLRVEAWVFPAYVLLYICVAAMQGIQRPSLALWIGLYRQIAAPAAAFPLLTVSVGMGIIGIWWGIFSVTWSAALFVVFYVTRVLKMLEKEIVPP
ncbi:MATE family efflux transporter [Geobacter sp. SVR]|uniref:MATE family efflux transporter n=1 Tax=Geobacter sp. SVR TaxID=2495594 RepID=UPI00143EFC5C|nr:MATE family efflux transporter [Geobacter sp. SVR]BCS54244.1 MATE family efflux transporter [Geobacter sp. SVR]GCF85898.1 MATE family efflux transporter [Geobacter sp. SVR]